MSEDHITPPPLPEGATRWELNGSPVYPHFDPAVHVLTATEAAMNMAEREMEREHRAMYREMYDVDFDPIADVRRRHRASAIQALGDKCAEIFWADFTVDRFRRQQFDDDTFKRGQRLEDELRRLDYEPVLNYFFPRGLYQVLYDESDVFVFTFKVSADKLHHAPTATREALIYYRAQRQWGTPIEIPMAEMRPKLQRDPAGMGWTAPRVSMANSLGGATNPWSPTATPDECTACGVMLYHPPYNPKLQYCPACGVPAMHFRSHNAIQPSTPSGCTVAPASTVSSKPAPMMKCPSCWTEFAITEEIRDRAAKTTGKIASGCSAGCKVDAKQLWEKMFKVIPTGCLP